MRVSPKVPLFALSKRVEMQYSEMKNLRQKSFSGYTERVTDVGVRRKNVMEISQLVLLALRQSSRAFTNQAFENAVFLRGMFVCWRCF